ncbi:uncharacterized protein LOC127731826 [Mytilus californianus]|uniref:uncharacterized protein LOC127731826 n=1 Tax=Mytilus californianus TaxID=6549 RepID=UPI002247DE7A|nr:uncharacterized protein LOC127731826 [Mytilus californianus]
MKKKQYDPNALKYAYDAVQNGMSVYQAAKNYGIPESTLRDRTLGLVSVDGRCSNYLFDEGIMGKRKLQEDILSNKCDIFKTYLEKHFLKYVSHDISGTPLLILFDGHRSNVSLTLQDWAESKNIILFILPPHCSHILQPLDIGCFGPLKACYNREAQLFMRRNPGCKITKFNIGQMSCSPYQKGLSAQNLTSSFKKSGIYPFNPKAVDTTELAPATFYH